MEGSPLAAAGSARVRPTYVFDGLTIATDPPSARFRIGISAFAQVEVNGPTTPITLGFATYARAFAEQVSGSATMLAAVASLQTCRPTWYEPALYPRCASARVIASIMGLVIASTPCWSGRSATISTPGAPAPS